MDTRSERRSSPVRRERISTLIHLSIAWSSGFAIMAVVALQNAVPAESLLLDRAVIDGGRWYQGMITSLGILAWTVAAVSSAGAAFVARVANRPQAASAFSRAAIVLAVLIFDDLFLLHSTVIPRFIGVPKLTVVAIEGVAVCVWLATAKAEIARTRWELLAAAGLGLGTSVLFDVFHFVGDPRWNLLAEDGAKFLGLLALAVWAVSSARDLAASAVSNDALPAAGAARRAANRSTLPVQPPKARPVVPTANKPGNVRRPLETAGSGATVVTDA